MKKLIIASMLIVGLTAGNAFAYGHGYQRMGGGGPMMKGNQAGMMYGAGMAGGCQGPRWSGATQMTDEQRQQFLDSTVALRKQMSEKRFELREAARNPNTTPAQLATIEKEIIDIRTSIHEQALKYKAITK